MIHKVRFNARIDGDIKNDKGEYFAGYSRWYEIVADTLEEAIKKMNEVLGENETIAEIHQFKTETYILI